MLWAALGVADRKSQIAMVAGSWKIHGLTSIMRGPGKPDGLFRQHFFLNVHVPETSGFLILFLVVSTFSLTIDEMTTIRGPSIDRFAVLFRGPRTSASIGILCAAVIMNLYGSRLQSNHLHVVSQMVLISLASFDSHKCEICSTKRTCVSPILVFLIVLFHPRHFQLLPYLCLSLFSFAMIINMLPPFPARAVKLLITVTVHKRTKIWSKVPYNMCSI